ncbi:hypothetical protein ACFOSS_08485 [Pseudaeromonas sharmana]|uniref:Uncharacterized protein n=1 Tax=Pseudaeromonas sharmana TaxID=328412 RepID=A0ABV8CMS5_9GAMM
MDIRRCELMPTRPCNYGLALQDDSVFADFGLSEKGSLYLVRISYDGYGCCEPKAAITEMDDEKSKLLISAIERNDFQSVEIQEIVSGYFREHKHELWEDALLEHKLI